jgi:hypothetical protein
MLILFKFNISIAVSKFLKQIITQISVILLTGYVLKFTV